MPTWEADDLRDAADAPISTPDPPVTLTSELSEDDLGLDRTLRPQLLDDYLGQSRVKENLSVLIAAARARGDVLDHLLFSGPPGLGKTTLAGVVANELGVALKATSGPAIERAGDLAAILTNLEAGDVLFIDEIHRLNRAVEEVLYPAMEDFVLDIVIGKGPSARSLRLEVPRFTLVGATTRTGLLTGPLRDRFGIAFRLDYYTAEELRDIVTRSAAILKVDVDEVGAREIARRSRGTPRLANRLLKRVRDFAEVRADGRIDLTVACEALGFFQVDELGLDNMDNKILNLLTQTFAGRAIGLGTLASALGEDPESLEDVYEPYLLQQGLIVRTPRGRMATERAFTHRGLPSPHAQDAAGEETDTTAAEAGAGFDAATGAAQTKASAATSTTAAEAGAHAANSAGAARQFDLSSSAAPPEKQGGGNHKRVVEQSVSSLPKTPQNKKRRKA